MSFTDEVKHEITRIKSSEKCWLAELAALIRMDGSIQIINKELAVKIRFFHGDLARKIYSLIKNRFEFKIEIVVRRRSHFSSYQNAYELFIPPQKGVKGFLKDLGFLDEDNSLIFKIKGEFIEDGDCRRSFLRGAFLGGGSVNTPDSEYHLEFRCEHRGFAEDLVKLLERFELTGGLNENHGKYVVYIKSFDEIITILNLIGAHQALLKMENKRVVKDLKNDVNRKVNFETANLDKTIKAAMLQLEDIELIEASRGLDSLPGGLKELALLRIDNPYASLRELGELLEPSLSKSGVNHRMRRIKKIAAKIRGES